MIKQLSYTRKHKVFMQIYNEGHQCPITKTFSDTYLKDVFFEAHNTAAELHKILPNCTFTVALEVSGDAAKTFHITPDGKIFNVEWHCIGNMAQIPDCLHFYFATAILRDGEHEYLEKGVCCADRIEVPGEIFAERWTPNKDDYRILKDVSIREITEEEFNVLNIFF